MKTLELILNEIDEKTEKTLIDAVKKFQLKPGYPKEFVLNILSNINEGYYRPEHIDELFQLWQTEVNGR